MRLKGKPPNGLPAMSYVGAPEGTIVGWKPVTGQINVTPERVSYTKLTT